MKNNKNKKTGVTVIMPVHGEPPAFVAVAVESVLAQSLPIEEMVICDDGCRAETKEYLQNLKNRQKIVLVQNRRAKGAAAARNRAIRCASGRYIALMDADDISDASRLQKEWEFLEKHPRYGFVGCKGAFFVRQPGDMQRHYWYVLKPRPKDFLVTLPFVHASLLFRREALEAVGSYREAAWVKRSEDYDLLLRLYAAGYRGANLPEALYHIRLDQATLKRRKYRYRFCEAAVKLVGFTKLGLMPIGIFFAAKPLVVGLLPKRLLEWGKEKYYDGKSLDEMPSRESMAKKKGL